MLYDPNKHHDYERAKRDMHNSIVGAVDKAERKRRTLLGLKPKVIVEYSMPMWGVIRRLRQVRRGEIELYIIDDLVKVWESKSEYNHKYPSENWEPA